MTIGGATSMYINYRAANGGTPTEWLLAKMLGLVFQQQKQQQHFGNVSANGTIYLYWSDYYWWYN